MNGDAIKHVADTLIAGIEPTDQEAANAIAEAVDLAVGFFADVRRIADAAVRLSDCVPMPGEDFSVFRHRAE